MLCNCTGFMQLYICVFAIKGIYLVLVGVCMDWCRKCLYSALNGLFCYILWYIYI